MKGQLLHKVFHTLTEAFQNCLRRFPSTVCFVLALTAYLAYLVSTEMDDEKKLTKEFPFSEEGKLAAVDWLNEQYESRKEEWDAAKHTDWSSLRK